MNDYRGAGIILYDENTVLLGLEYREDGPSYTSFGGRREKDDKNSFETAIREFCEELFNIMPDDEDLNQFEKIISPYIIDAIEYDQGHCYFVSFYVWDELIEYLRKKYFYPFISLVSIPRVFNMHDGQIEDLSSKQSSNQSENWNEGWPSNLQTFIDTRVTYEKSKNGLNEIQRVLLFNTDFILDNEEYDGVVFRPFVRNFLFHLKK